MKVVIATGYIMTSKNNVSFLGMEGMENVYLQSKGNEAHLGKKGTLSLFFTVERRSITSLVQTP